MKIEKVIAKIERDIGHCEDDTTMMYVPHYILTQLIGAIKAQQWIPVSERWPEDHSEVLGCYELGFRIVYFNRRIGFHVLDDDCDEIVIKITHWMPLTEPPEVE